MLKVILKPHILPFILLIVLAVVTQSIQMQPVWDMGFSRDGWGIYLTGKMVNTSPIETIKGCWILEGPHNAYRCIYFTTVDSFFKDNYHVYVKLGLIFKILGSLMLYPLILTLFKSRLLAFLTSLIYMSSHASYGSIAETIDGVEYLSLLFLCLSLISYYYLSKKFSFTKLMITAILLFLMFVLAPIRTFPLFAIIILIEVFESIKNPSSIYQAVIKIVIFLTPIIFILFRTSISTGDLRTITIYPFIDGNWYISLIPIAGLGYTILNVFQFGIFGSLTLQHLIDFTRYVQFLILPSIIFGVISFALAFLITKRIKRFVLIMIVSNLTVDLLVFLLQTHHFYISDDLSLKPDLTILVLNHYGIMVGMYVILLAINCIFFYFTEDRRNKFLLIPLISIFFSLVFLYGTFIFTGYHFRYQTGIHRYLVMVEIGISLFLGYFLTQAYYKTPQRYKLYTATILIPIILSAQFLSSTQEINNFFLTFRARGNDINMENFMQKQVINKIPKEKLNQKVFIYLESVKDPLNLPWVTATDAYYLQDWFSIRKSYLVQNRLDGCIARILEFDELKKAVTLEKGVKGFLTEGKCLGESVKLNTSKIFFTIDDFYAFRIDGSKIVDIKEEILRKISTEGIN